ncbi:MAG: calcium-binding protein [Pikeienuella sp.]
MARYSTKVASNTVSGSLGSNEKTSGALTLPGWKGLGRPVSASLQLEAGFLTAAAVPNHVWGGAVTSIATEMSARFTPGARAPFSEPVWLPAANMGVYPVFDPYGLGFLGYPVAEATARSKAMKLNANQIENGVSAKVGFSGDFTVKSGGATVRDPAVPTNFAFAGLSADFRVAAHKFNQTANRAAGTKFADVVEMMAGDDLFRGLAGNDVVIGGAGKDRLIGNGGDDQLRGNGGADELKGGGGDDTLKGGGGGDRLGGGRGDDDLKGGGRGDQLKGGAGDDTLSGDKGADKLLGQAGDDMLKGGADRDTLDGGDGADRLSGDGGNDMLLGGKGADKLHGGDGDDRLQGGNHNDTLDGGAGNDTLSGESGDDTLTGGGGRDSLLGGDGDDEARGGDGADSLTGHRGGDMLHGGAGDDRIWANQGDDFLFGEAGNDILRGGDGKDWFYGGAGDDTIYGEKGENWYEGGGGRDLLVAGPAGSGADTFRFLDISDSRAGAARDVILNFRNAEDSITLYELDANANMAGQQRFAGGVHERTTPGAYQAWHERSGGDLLIRADATGDAKADFEIELRGVTRLEFLDVL